ncbi:unnamed protein product [Adineta steineri]|uniref:G-protein coupled receptors family 1 profile domain-containing protein n=1 Tax=Adineta steineri TaxID=433720 RepID=A0A813NWU4_9BILA|nr:unnamed protein product [Adineta steineri]CAF3789119.1 unnamed protein product [Adineta steineri]
MSNISSYENTVELFDNLTVQIDRYFTVFIFIFAVVGNSLNVLVLSQRTLRSNPCAWLFLTSTIADLISVLFGLTTRILAGWATDPTNTNSLLCKFRGFILFSSRTTAFWLIALATVDRWIASSRNARYRQMNTLKNIKICFIIVVFISILIYSQIFYCYKANLVNTPLKCYGKSFVCQVISDTFYGGISVILPLILMIVFGLKTIFNIHQIQIRVHPRQIPIVGQNNSSKNIHSKEQSVHWKKQDRHLFSVLITQVIVQGILTLPQVVAKVYITSTTFQIQTPLKLSFDRFIYNIALLLSFVANGMPFYIYTLCGGSSFQKPLLHIIHVIIEKLMYFK